MKHETTNKKLRQETPSKEIQGELKSAFKIGPAGEDFAAAMWAQQLPQQLPADPEPAFELCSGARKFHASDTQMERRVAEPGLTVLAASTRSNGRPRSKAASKVGFSPKRGPGLDSRKSQTGGYTP